MAEVGFAVLGEELGDSALVAGFDLAVEVDEVPSEAVGEESAGGGFAGSHEASEDDAVKDVRFPQGLAQCGFGFVRHGLGGFG